MKGLACLVAVPHDPFAEMLAVELGRLFDRVTLLAPHDAVPPCALRVVDLDAAHGEPSEGAHRIGYTEKQREATFPVLRRPFAMTELRRLILLPEGAPLLVPSEDFRTVTVEGEPQALTEREAHIFRLLYEAEGAPVSRAYLTREVFPDAREGEDALNVYIHYLRKKLERNGRRLIRAHRGGGYALLLD